jgi:hypothetical protein
MIIALLLLLLVGLLVLLLVLVLVLELLVLLLVLLLLLQLQLLLLRRLLVPLLLRRRRRRRQWQEGLLVLFLLAGLLLWNECLRLQGKRRLCLRSRLRLSMHSMVAGTRALRGGAGTRGLSGSCLLLLNEKCERSVAGNKLLVELRVIGRRNCLEALVLAEAARDCHDGVRAGAVVRENDCGRKSV